MASLKALREDKQSKGAGLHDGRVVTLLRVGNDDLAPNAAHSGFWDATQLGLLTGARISELVDIAASGVIEDRTTSAVAAGRKAGRQAGDAAGSDEQCGEPGDVRGAPQARRESQGNRSVVVRCGRRSAECHVQRPRACQPAVILPRVSPEPSNRYLVARQSISKGGDMACCETGNRPTASGITQACSTWRNLTCGSATWPCYPVVLASLQQSRLVNQRAKAKLQPRAGRLSRSTRCLVPAFGGAGRV